MSHAQMLIKDMKELSYAQSLEPLNLFSLLGRLLHADPIKPCQDVGIPRMFVAVPQKHTQGYSLKLSVP